MDHQMLSNHLIKKELQKSTSLPIHFSDMAVKMTTIKPNPSAQTSGNVTFVDLGKELLQAAKDGNKDKVLDCLKQGAPMTSDWLGTSPLHIAAKSNYFEICTILIRAGVSKDAKTKVDRTALHFAAFEGNFDIVKMLLSCKCEVDATDMLKMTPLHWAVENNFPQIADLLLEHGANPNSCSKFGKTPLSIAQEKNDEALVELIENYASKSNESKQTINCEAINSLNQEHEITLQEIKKPEILQHPAFSELNGSPSDRPKRSKKNHVENQKLTLQILRDHGIQMIQPDVDSNSLIHSAMQDGRQIVLSEAGKMMLNVLPKLPLNTTITSQPSVTNFKPSMRPVPPLSKLDETGKPVESSLLTLTNNQNFRIMSQAEYSELPRPRQRSVSTISSASKAIKKTTKSKFQLLQDAHYRPSSSPQSSDDHNFSTMEDYLDDTTSTSTPVPPTTPITPSFPASDVEALIERKFGELSGLYRDLKVDFQNEQKKSESYRRKLMQLQRDFHHYKQQQQEKFNSMLKVLQNQEDVMIADQDVIEEDFL